MLKSSETFFDGCSRVARMIQPLRISPHNKSSEPAPPTGPHLDKALFCSATFSQSFLAQPETLVV